MRQVYTIIVTFNASIFIDRCLQALKESSHQTNVIIIDNASNDDTIVKIKKNFSDAILIESSANLGFGVANNIGIKKAIELGCDYVFLLNQDAFVKENTIKDLVQCATEYSMFDLISPVHLNGAGDALDYSWEEYYVSTYNCPGFISDSYLGGAKKLYEVNFVNAAAWLLTPTCLKLVGGFNPYFFMYGEDRDYVNRMRARGLRLGICYHARVTHERARPVELQSPSFSERKKSLSKYYFLRSETELLNINMSFFVVFFKGHLNISLMILKNFLLFRFKEWFILLLLEIKLLYKTRSYLKYRKISRNNQFAYLSVDNPY